MNPSDRMKREMLQGLFLAINAIEGLASELEIEDKPEFRNLNTLLEQIDTYVDMEHFDSLTFFERYADVFLGPDETGIEKLDS